MVSLYAPDRRLGPRKQDDISVQPSTGLDTAHTPNADPALERKRILNNVSLEPEHSLTRRERELKATSADTSPEIRAAHEPQHHLPPSPPAPQESVGFWGSVRSWGTSAAQFVSDATGVTNIYQGIRDRDVKKLAIGACQLAGTALSLTTGAGLGMIVVGATLENAGSIAQAITAGSPAAIAGAVVGLGVSIVCSKFGNGIAQKVMGALAPVNKAVLSESLAVVGQGLGQRVGSDIIATHGASALTKMATEAGTNAGTVVARELDTFIGPAITAAKEAFGATSEEVRRVATEKMSALAEKSITSEVDKIMTKLGVTDRVSSIVTTELIDKASNAGVLGQLGFGGGRALSYLGLGNSSLTASIKSAAPELSDEAAKLLSKNLCRAVQQGVHRDILTNSLTDGITDGLQKSLREVLENPMKKAFMDTIDEPVKNFLSKHGIEHLQDDMLQAAEIGMEAGYRNVLRAHVHAGVEKAVSGKRSDKYGPTLGVPASAEARDLSTAAPALEKPDALTPKTPEEHGKGDGHVRVHVMTRRAVVGNTVTAEVIEVTEGRQGTETRILDSDVEPLQRERAS